MMNDQGGGGGNTNSRTMSQPKKERAFIIFHPTFSCRVSVSQPWEASNTCLIFFREVFVAYLNCCCCPLTHISSGAWTMGGDVVGDGG